MRFILNRDAVATDQPAGRTLLDHLRVDRQLTGTKAGCRAGDCGSCMVLLGTWDGSRLDYQPINACLLPLGEVDGKHVVTIEGLNDATLNPIQQAMVERGAVQCGFCTPGLVMATTAFLLNSETLDGKQGELAISGNLCRCTGYVAIKRVIGTLCKQFQNMGRGAQNRLEALVERQVLPNYFLDIPARLRALTRRVPVTAAPKSSAVRVAGGTDLYVQRPEELAQAKLDFFLRRESLKGIRLEQNRCVIGATTTVEEMRQSDVLRKIIPNIDEHLTLFCSTPVRQRATVAGNIVNGSPVGDLIVLFLALDATIGLNNGNHRRKVGLKDLYKGYKQLDKTADEWIEWIGFEMLPNASFHYEKVSKRTYLDIASVNLAMQILIDAGNIKQVHLAAGGVAPIPLYLSATVNYLRGKALRPEFIREAAAIARTEVAPISDIRGSADYKKLLLRQLIIVHFLVLLPQQLDWEVLQ